MVAPLITPAALGHSHYHLLAAVLAVCIIALKLTKHPQTSASSPGNWKLTAKIPLTAKQKAVLKFYRKLFVKTNVIGENTLPLPPPGKGESLPKLIVPLKDYKDLYVSSALGYQTSAVKVAKYLKNKLHIKKVISLEENSWNSEKKHLGPGVQYVEIYVEDYGPPTVEAINEMITSLVDSGEHDTVTLLHCLAGHGRTGFMVAILLSILHQVHIIDAVKLVGEIYPPEAMSELKDLESLRSESKRGSTGFNLLQ